MARLRLAASEVGLTANDINAAIHTILQRRVPSITKNPQLRQSIGYVMIDMATPFVPMSKDRKDSGNLREGAQATLDGRLIWSAANESGNYAHYQYKIAGPPPTYTTKRYTTEGTRSHWVDAVDRAEFMTQITPLIIEEFNNG